MSDEKPLALECETHGKQGVSVVCGHLLDADRPEGFVENSAVPGNYQAWCDACEALFIEDEGMSDRFHLFTRMSVVCEACYHEIKARYPQA